jgi:hypothetical protein
MTRPTGESESDALRFDFDRRLMLQFRGFVVTSKAGAFVDDEILNFHAARSLDGNPIKANILSDLRTIDLGQRGNQWVSVC